MWRSSPCLLKTRWQEKDHVNLLELPGELRVLEVLHGSISLFVQVSDVLPETIHSFLPLHCGHISRLQNTGIAAYYGAQRKSWMNTHI